jgi:hypothetical protein
MKRLTAIALAFLFTAPVAAEEVDRTLNAASDGAVEVSNIAGSVTVEGWSRNEVQVKGTLGRNVEELIFERDGDRVTIKVKVPKRGGRGIDSDLRISIPRRASAPSAVTSTPKPSAPTSRPARSVVTFTSRVRARTPKRVATRSPATSPCKAWPAQ